MLAATVHQLINSVFGRQAFLTRFKGIKKDKTDVAHFRFCSCSLSKIPSYNIWAPRSVESREFWRK